MSDVNTSLWPASSRSRASASVSESGSGRSRGAASRMTAGTAASASSWSDRYPRVASIAAWPPARGPMCRSTNASNPGSSAASWSGMAGILSFRVWGASRERPDPPSVAELQSCLTPTVRVPERFRGVVAPSAPGSLPSSVRTLPSEVDGDVGSTIAAPRARSCRAMNAKSSDEEVPDDGHDADDDHVDHDDEHEHDEEDEAQDEADVARMESALAALDDK